MILIPCCKTCNLCNGAHPQSSHIRTSTVHLCGNKYHTVTRTKGQACPNLHPQYALFGCQFNVYS